jgi:CheY-like chemotaxis protein
METGFKRILVVDPDSTAARELLSLLVDEGYEVEISGGIRKAAERVRDVKFDCAIIDVDLPEMAGYEAVSILKAIDPKIQVIMTAAVNSPELEVKVRKEDIFYYHIKSFDAEELKEAVRDVFRRLGKTKEVRRMAGSQKILLVDDDTSLVAAMTSILESEGYEVEAAYDKADAMERIDRFRPDLILLDIMMEKLTDGFDICYKLKHDPEMKKIPVLVVSSITEKTGFRFSPTADGEYFEADGYMEKPVKPSDLLRRIEQLLKG